MVTAAVFDGSVVPLRRTVQAELPEEQQLALYDPSGAGLVVLNRSSAVVWELCNGTATLDEILATLVARYDAEPETLRADLWQTYTKLVELGLLSR